MVSMFENNLFSLVTDDRQKNLSVQQNSLGYSWSQSKSDIPLSSQSLCPVAQIPYTLEVACPWYHTGERLLWK